MHISGMNPQHAHGQHTTLRGQSVLPEHAGKHGTMTAPVSERPAEQAAMADSVRHTTHEHEHDHHSGQQDARQAGQHAGPPGLMRLLESGHFSAVAAVRLAVNFHAQIEQRGQERAAATLDAAVGSLAEQVAGVLAELPEGSVDSGVPSVSDSQASLVNAMQAVAARFRAGDIDGEAALAGLQTAYDDMLQALGQRFSGQTGVAEQSAAPTAAQQDTAAVQAADSPAAGVADALPSGEQGGGTGASLLSALEGIYRDVVDTLQSALAVVPVTGDFGAPHGHGVAFGKFMAIYQAVSGAEPPDAATPAPDAPAGVDLVA